MENLLFLIDFWSVFIDFSMESRFLEGGEQFLVVASDGVGDFTPAEVTARLVGDCLQAGGLEKPYKRLIRT